MRLNLHNTVCNDFIILNVDVKMGTVKGTFSRFDAPTLCFQQCRLIVSPEEHVRSQRNGRNMVGARGKDGRTDGRTDGLAGRTDVSGGRGTQVRIHREWPGWLDGRMCQEAEEQVKRHRESHGRTGTKDGKTQGRAFGRADGRTGGPSGAREGGMSGPRGRCQD